MAIRKALRGADLIQIFLTREHSYTVARAAHHELMELIKPLPYEDAMRRKSLHSGCYVFSDLDRLTTSAHRSAVRLHEQLSSDPRSTILNDPSRSLTRLALLERMEKEGINPFRVRPLKRWKELRFPIFLREQDAHTGPLTDLLNSAEAVKSTINRLRLSGMTARHLMAVEYCDTSAADGRFRKYGAFRVGDRIVPRHVMFSTNWRAKRSDWEDEETVKEEFEFIESNPHEALLKPIFDIANIEYGRMDYSFRDGRLVVWEINPNPSLVPPPSRRARDDELRAPAKRTGIELLRGALAELDRTTKRSDPGQVPLQVSRTLIARAAGESLIQRARYRWFSTVRSALGTQRP